MIRPVDAPVGQGFGENPTKHNPSPLFGNYQPDGHAGQDYPVPVGTPIRAVTSGVVKHVGYYSGTYADNPYWIAPNFAGFCYVIDHGSFIGIYAHGKDYGAQVFTGSRVTEGQVIGISGNTGGSTGPHLHFEILPDRYNLYGKCYGRIDPETLFNGTITAQGATTEEDFMGGFIDARQAEDIAARAAELVIAHLDKGLTRIHALQAESIVSATTERTTANLKGDKIDAGQADDIAQAAARYSKEN